MELSKPLGLTLLLLATLLWPSTSEATNFSISGVFLGEPNVFVPGVGLDMEISLASPLGLLAGMALFLSGSWDLIAGVVWHASSQLALHLQALFLFDVVDGFIPQLGTRLRLNLPLSCHLWFFNELGLNMPRAERFLQPTYSAGFLLSF